MSEGRELHLYDVSQYIAAGSKNLVLSGGVSMDGDRFRPIEMPCGGVTYLLNVIHEHNKPNADLVFCCDRPPLIKRRIHEKHFPYQGGYKGNRAGKDESILFQRRLAEDVLQECGFNVLAVADMEADDLIASVVKYYKDDYEKVYIHSLDSDLFYLVCSNVEIAPLTDGYFINGMFKQNGKKITMQNWEDAVDSKFTIPYDTLTIQKMCMGESGDNIPAIPKQMADRILQHIPKEQYVKCGDNDLLRKWVLEAVSGDEYVKAVLDLIIPIEVAYKLVELNETDFRQDVYETYAYYLKNKYAKYYQPKYKKAEEVLNKYVTEYDRR